MTRILWALSVFLFLSFSPSAKAESPAFFLLHPQSKIEITLHGVCRVIENKSTEAVAYIPTATKDVWENFDSRKDETGAHEIVVSPCE